MRRARFLVVAMALVLAVLVPLRVAAEVSAEVGSEGGGQASSVIILGAILDDPQPILNYWLRQHLQGSNYEVLNEGGDANGDGRPDLLVHPTTRVPVVVWARNSPSGFDVVVSRFEQGSWTGPEAVVDEIADALDPRVGVDPSTGDVHLVYWVDDATPRVEHRVAPADLSAWSAPTVVSGVGEAAERPHLVFHEGVLRVAYEVHVTGPETTPREVVIARREAGGFVPEIVAITHHAGEVRPEVHSAAGKLWVDWVDSDGEMAWTRFDPATSGWESIRTEPYASLEDLECHVRGAIRMQATE